MRKKVAAAFCAAVVAGLGASAAVAGEIKGPPYQGAPVAGGIGNETNTTPAGEMAHSLCSFSGLNDFDSTLGQTSKPTQTPADGPAGAPGHGFELIPGLFVSCRGN
jgi:hypothetical protein